MLAVARSWCSVPRMTTFDLSAKLQAVVQEPQPHSWRAAGETLKCWRRIARVHRDEQLHVVGELVVRRTMRLDAIADWWHVCREEQRPKYRALRHAALAQHRGGWMLTESFTCCWRSARYECSQAMAAPPAPKSLWSRWSSKSCAIVSNSADMSRPTNTLAFLLSAAVLYYTIVHAVHDNVHSSTPSHSASNALGAPSTNETDTS